MRWEFSHLSKSPGEAVTVPALILMGAAGAVLRGLLDVYARFVGR